MRPNRQDGALGGSKDFFGDGAEQQLAEAGAAMSSKHHQVNVVLLDGLFQFRRNITFFDQHLGGNSAEGLQKFTAVFFILRFCEFYVDRPGSGPSHRIYNSWPNVKSENVGFVML